VHVNCDAADRVPIVVQPGLKGASPTRRSRLETECRSLGDERCKFLVGTPEKLQKVHDELYGQAS